MERTIARRLALAAPTLLTLATLAFFLTRLAPGGPFNLARPLDPIVMDNLRRLYRLDEPIWRQYLDYLTALAHGDLGPSYSWRDFSVAQLLVMGFPISLRLGGLAMIAALVVGSLAGIAAAAQRCAALDHAIAALASIGLIAPTFVLAPALQLIFGLWLKVLPVGGWNDGAPANLVLPVVALAAPQIAAIGRLVRAGMIEALASPATRALHAYGLPRRIVLAHAFRAASLPLISYLGPAAAALLTGSVVIETIFGLPGIGRYFVAAALDRDYPLAMGAALLAATLIVVVNLIVDVAYALIDPRVRRE